MDVEEYARRYIRAGKAEEEIFRQLTDLIHSFKPEEPAEYARAFAQAVIDEARTTEGKKGDYFSFTPASVKMGEFGVGSRGTGDFFVHRQIARIIGKTGAFVGVDELDDAGAVEVTRGGSSRFVVCTVDGMHSRHENVWICGRDSAGGPLVAPRISRVDSGLLR